jgi:6-phosphogluconolactonase
MKTGPTMTRRSLLRATPLLAAATLTRPAASEQRGNKRMLYIGTYAGENQPGIFIFEQDGATGDLRPLGDAAGVNNPSFLAVSPDKKFIYAACEAYGPGGGQIAAFALDPATGMLAFLNKESAGGQGPCHLSVSRDGKCVVAANYGSGNVISLPVKPDGSLGPLVSNQQHTGSSVNQNRQKEPHAHSITVDATGKYAVAADLGTDKLYVYQLDGPKATLTPHTPESVAAKPGAGPRHFAFHPNGKFAYAINELDNTVTLYAWDAKAGTLTPVESVPTLPADFSGNSSTAEVRVHPSGQFLYGSNRGHDSIAAFKIDPTTGKLTPLGHTPTGGKTPRNFNLSPDGAFLIAANQETGNVVIFRIDPKTGTLAPTGKTYEVPKPVCALFV